MFLDEEIGTSLEPVLLYLEQGVPISTLASSYGVAKITINCAKLSYFESKFSQKVDKTAYSSKPLTATSKGLSRMKQGRQTTFEERVEIVNFTIAHDKDYQAAIEKYNVSYQQVYSWVRKFEKDGSQGLLDRRGKGLESKPNLTPEEEL